MPPTSRDILLEAFGIALPHGRHGPASTATRELAIPAGHRLVVAVDTLVNGVHFPPETHPSDIGHKSLAVNLSDIAAMGARPRAAAVCICLPARDPVWLRAFATGLRALADRFAVEFLSVEVADGPLTVTVQVLGDVPRGSAIERTGARPGDTIHVTGTLGDAALALTLRAGGTGPWGSSYLRGRLDHPSPRVRAGLAIRGLASAAIDVSDGLAADLGHLLDRSGRGATIEVSRLPLSAALAGAVDGPTATRLALSGGDDYELCFTVPAGAAADLARRSARLGCAQTEIGVIEDTPGLRLRTADGSHLRPAPGYRHFAS